MTTEKTITVLSSTGNYVDKLKEIFAKSPRNARVYALSNTVQLNEKRLIEEGNNICIISTQTTFGVSTNDKLYSRSKVTQSLIAKDNKFWVKDHQVIRPMSIGMLYTPSIREIFVQKYSWIGFLHEFTIPLTFNTVVRNKLFSARKALTHMYGIPWPICKEVHTKVGSSFKIWKEAKKSITNLQSFNIELLEDMTYFYDCTSLARKLNVKINAAWTLRRLQEEHDNMSNEVTTIMYTESNEYLYIAPEFKAVSKFIGGLITDTKGLAIEGNKMKHCVAGYSNQVNSGQCAIFHYKNHTLELRKNVEGQLYIRQFKGFANVEAPNQLKQEIQNILVENYDKVIHTNYLVNELVEELAF